MALTGIRKRKVAGLTYTANAIHRPSLGNLQQLRQLIFEVTGTITVTGANGDGVLVVDGLLKTFLKSIELEVGGLGKIHTTGLLEYYSRAHFSSILQTYLATAITSAGAKAFHLSCILDLDIPLTRDAWAGRINARDQTVVLVVRMGDGATIGGDLVASGTDAYVTAAEVEVVAVYDRKRSENRFGTHTIEYFNNVIAGATDRFRFELDPGKVYTHLVMNAVDNSIKDDDIVTNVQVQKGQDDIYRDLSWEAVQSDAMAAFGITPATGEYPHTGIGFLDFNLDRDLATEKLLDARTAKAKECAVVLTVGSPTGTAYVEIAAHGIEGIPGRM